MISKKAAMSKTYRPWLVALVCGLLLGILAASHYTEAQSSSFVFTAGGDHGAPIGSDTRSSLQAIVDSGAVFHLALGDMSYTETGQEPTDGTSPSPWCSGDDPNQNIKFIIGERFPFQLVVGSNEDDDFVDGYIGNFAACLPDRMNSTGVYGAEYYFDYPQTDPLMRAIMIGAKNTVNGELYDYVAENSHYQWLAQVIDEARWSGIDWVVVGMHQNCLTMGSKGCEIGEDLMDLLIEKRVDLVLQAHDHTYQRSKQLTCATATTFDEACVADDGADGIYTKGAGPVFVINGVFGGGEFTGIDCQHHERFYFAKAMGGGGNVWNGQRCTIQWVGRGLSAYTVTSDQLEARFIMTERVRGSNETFADEFRIVREGSPTPVVLPTPTPTATPIGRATLKLNAVADAYISQGESATNYGTNPALRTDASPPTRSYLRFVVPGLSGSLIHATLRVYANSGSIDGYDVYDTESGWGEDTLTYDNAPAYDVYAGSSGPFEENTWTEVDVTAIVTKEGAVNLVLVSDGNTATSFSSREGANPPELLVEVS